MDNQADSLTKHREIAFSKLHPDPNQAQSAVLLLSDIKGVERVHFVSPILMTISYNVLHITLQQIEEILAEMGFHLDNRLMYRLKRALYYYTEETQRANCGCEHGDSNCTQKVFIKRYQNMKHGCRDQRPTHWRKYL
ncbi:MAG: hypothetical protein PVG66_05700 [Chromatiales bacterium]|jgi:hypothetical protein